VEQVIELRPRKKTARTDDNDDTRGGRAIRWIEKYCRLPEGKNVGGELKLAKYQKDDLRAIYNNPYGETRRAIISRGRKNAKTSTCAFILLLHLCGPERKVNSQIFSCAQSRDQAAILFSLAAKIVRLSPKLHAIIQIRDTAKELLCPDLGTFYKALSAEASTALGLNPSLVLFDELGQVRGPRSDLFEAMNTATAAQENPLSIIISTQAPTDGDLLSILIDDAQSNNDPTIVLRFDTAPEDIDPFSEKAIRLANPAFDVFMNKKEVLAMAQDAKRMPAREAQYRNLILNQRIDASTPFIAPAEWKACSEPAMDLTGREVFVGLDLSATKDLTALVVVGVDILTGIWHCRPYFWIPSEGLQQKSQADRVPYDLWADRGHLQATPGTTVSYEFVAYELKKIMDTHKVIKIAFDRWGMQNFKPWIIQAGMSEQEFKEKFVAFGQGYASMSPALRDLEAIIADKKLRHGNQPVLTMCMNNSIIERDPAGNRKLSKKRSTGRIDGAVALTMAVGVAPLRSSTVDIASLIG
jgi:phage terminase large subunit-like protein